MERGRDGRKEGKRISVKKRLQKVEDIKELEGRKS